MRLWGIRVATLMAAESAVHAGVDPALLMVGRRGSIGMRDGVWGSWGLGCGKRAFAGAFSVGCVGSTKLSLA